MKMGLYDSEGIFFNSNGQTMLVPKSALFQTQSTAPSGSSKNSCAHCYKPGTKVCSRCRRINYCSEYCQKLAWKTHQIICNNTCLIPADNDIVCKFKEPSGSVRDMTQKEFKEKLQATYVRAPLYPKAILDNFTKSATPTQANCQVSDSIAIEHHGKAGYGLVALKDIPKSSILCNFGGMVYTRADWDKEIRTARSQLYSCMSEHLNYDPAEYMSLGAIVNEGPPNSELVTNTIPEIFSNIVTVPESKRLIAIRDIKAGEIIYAEYHPEHPIRSLHYAIDDITMHHLMQKYSQHIDVLMLNMSEWTLKAHDLDPSIYSTTDAVTIKEIQSIVTTPYLLVALHLRTNLDPNQTLKDLEMLSPKVYDSYRIPFEHAKVILKWLARLVKEDREPFLKIAEQISQLALYLTCKWLSCCESKPSMENCKVFATAVDKLIPELFGNTVFSWKYAEGEKFRKEFVTQDHQLYVFDDMAIKDLGKPYDILFMFVRRDLYNQVWIELSVQEQNLLMSMPITGRHVRKLSAMFNQK